MEKLLSLTNLSLHNIDRSYHVTRTEHQVKSPHKSPARITTSGEIVKEIPGFWVRNKAYICNYLESQAWLVRCTRPCVVAILGLESWALLSLLFARRNHSEINQNFPRPGQNIGTDFSSRVARLKKLLQCFLCLLHVASSEDSRKLRL